MILDLIPDILKKNINTAYDLKQNYIFRIVATLIWTKMINIGTIWHKMKALWNETKP